MLNTPLAPVAEYTQSAAPSRALVRWTALFLLLEFVLILVPTLGLGAVFQFPNILDQPGNYVLPLFKTNRALVMALYYVFTLSGIALIPLSLLLERVLASGQKTFMQIATAFGIVTALTQALGFIRWDFVVPYLADAYTAAHSSSTAQQTISLVYDSFNYYAGHAVGEHLGFLFNIIWGTMIGIAVVRSSFLRRWIGWIGVVTSLGVLAEILQLLVTSPAVQQILQQLFEISYSLWIVWLVVLAIALLRLKPLTTREGAL